MKINNSYLNFMSYYKLVFKNTNYQFFITEDLILMLLTFVNFPIFIIVIIITEEVFIISIRLLAYFIYFIEKDFM